MRGSIVLPLLLAITIAIVPPAHASSFTVTNLASDQSGVAATLDPQLVNAWGIAASPTGPFWIGSNGTGVSEIYNGAGVKQALVVTIPGDGSVTGVAFNTGASAGQFNGDAFLFVSEDGTISGWRGALGTTAEVLQLADPNDNYKGVAVGTIGVNTYWYIANFRNGKVDVMKGSASAPDLPGSFTDPGLPAGYAPFNVQNIGGVLYVAYAVQDAAKDDEVKGAGNGIVSKFNLDGTFIGRLTTGGALNAPWGLALAPAGFGSLAGSLLVGNFGDGTINAFDPITGLSMGALLDPTNIPIVIDGLWGLDFGNGANANALYFTAGPDDENHGLFGDITLAPEAVPEPATLALFGSGLLAVGFVRRRSSRR